MELQIEIKPDYNGTVSIIDYTQETEYINESETSLLPSYTKYKYSETFTIDVLKKIKVDGITVENIIYTDHNYPSDSVRFELPEDGYYSVDHIVLPTTQWLAAMLENNISLTFYKGIYVTDGYKIYKYKNGVTELSSPEELTEINPTDTTVSIATYKIFSIDNLKKCYVNVATKILCSGVKCGKIDEIIRFNRDFLWMTINVINFYLEEDEYSEAEIVLENLLCYNFCDSITAKTTKHVDCGCHH